MEIRNFLTALALVFFSISSPLHAKMVGNENYSHLVPVNSTNTFAVVDVKSIISKLPNGDRWIKHVNEDLLKFWDMPTALGNA